VAVQEVRVLARPDLPDATGEDLLYEVRNALGIKSVEKIRTARVFRFEGIDEQEADFLAKNLLAEEVFQSYCVNGPVIYDADHLLEVGYKPGVMNPEAASLVKAAADLGVIGLAAADSSREFEIGRASCRERV